MSEVTKEDIFAAFLNEKKHGTYKCPVCYTETFLINGVGDTEGPAIVKMDAGLRLEDMTGSHAFYSFSCANCGHTDFFHINQVNAWLAKRSPDAS